jgi:hypothetical protein
MYMAGYSLYSIKTGENSMLESTEINTTTISTEDSSEDGITGRWESEDEADGTVFEDESETEPET